MQAVLDLTRQLSPVTDVPQLEAEVLIAFILQKSRAWLRAHPEYTLTWEQAKRLDEVVQRRLQGEPLAYITGQQEFWSLPLEVTQATLIPRSDTECLVELALKLYPDKNQILRVVDLGTGSGAIALALASERPLWEISAVDVSQSALSIARKNAQALRLDRVSFYLGDWFTALPINRFDLVVANPPYLTEMEWPHYAAALSFEPRTALVSGQDGLDDIRRIVSSAPDFMASNGFLLLEHGASQGVSVRQILSAGGFVEVETVQDLSGRDRVTMGRLR